MKIDIFCRVIDFWGDVAVSWRLACALKKVQPQWDIIYYCDDWQPWCTLTGMAKVPEDYQGIALKNYQQKSYAQADIALEMLAGGLPGNYPAPKSMSVNVEYLTAEDWGADCHLKQSFPKPHFFFLPGISQGTGGLVFGDFFEKQVFVQDVKAQRLAWAKKMGLKLDPEKNWVSCYLYQISAQSLHKVQESIFLGPALPHIKPDFGHFIPMTLARYDELLWLCDQHLVRGEDSLSRAVLTGKPFLWQAYPQENEDHEKKVQALINQISQQEPTEKEMLQRHFFSLNRQQSIDWVLWQKEQNHLARNFKELQKRVIALGSQEMLLSQFILQKSL